MGDHEDHRPGSQAHAHRVGNGKAGGNAQADHGANGLHQARADRHQRRLEGRKTGCAQRQSHSEAFGNILDSDGAGQRQADIEVAAGKADANGHALGQVVQGDRQHEQPHAVDPVRLRAARAGAFVFVRGEAVEAEHQQHAQAHADHHRQCRVRAVAGDLPGCVEARQDQRERTGGEHHACGKPEHHILGARADFTQHHGHDRAQCGGGKPGEAAEHGHVQVLLVVAMHGIPGTGDQQTEHHQQTQAQACAKPRGTLCLLQPGVPQWDGGGAAVAVGGWHRDLSGAIR
ncbi:hypothetical protein D3C81_978070 [compost metagenome]